ncbi:MAG: hypothetical protein HPZ00_00680 [Christensenellaceae bacterium]|nr:hypothetical protein [Christensenellaceae bacterium]
MKNQDVEQRLKKDVEEITPNVIDSALEKCGGVSQSEKIRKRQPRVWQICAAAAAVLVLIIGGAFFISNPNAVDSVIGLDVNPSLEISINKNERVLSVTAVNDDALNILDGMDLAGTDLKVAVNALIGSMYTNGYISENQNSVLVSVKSGSQERGEALKQELLAYVESALKDKQVEGAVVSLNIAQSDTLGQLAQSWGVSQGKATLIEAILAADPSQNAEELAKLSINELNLLAQSKHISSVDVSGSASTSQYIGFENARQVVNQKLPGCNIIEFEMDWEDGRMVYEGEAYLDGVEYDFEVDALTGEIIKWKQDGHGSGALNPDEDYLSLEEAKNNILGKLPGGAVISSIKLDYDDGRAVYEADAYADSTVYDIEIDAVTGDTVKWEEENHGGQQGSQNISAEQAREIILAEFPGGQIIELESEADDGKYEGEIIADGTKYEFEISARTGEIIKLEKEHAVQQPKITREQAISLINEKLPGCTIIELKLDEDDGVPEYEGEAVLNGREYEFTINAVTGNITEWEVED